MNNSKLSFVPSYMFPKHLNNEQKLHINLHLWLGVSHTDSA